MVPAALSSAVVNTLIKQDWASSRPNRVWFQLRGTDSRVRKLELKARQPKSTRTIVQNRKSRGALVLSLISLLIVHRQSAISSSRKSPVVPVHPAFRGTSAFTLLYQSSLHLCATNAPLRSGYLFFASLSAPPSVASCVLVACCYGEAC